MIMASTNDDKIKLITETALFAVVMLRPFMSKIPPQSPKALKITMTLDKINMMIKLIPPTIKYALFAPVNVFKVVISEYIDPKPPPSTIFNENNEIINMLASKIRLFPTTHLICDFFI